MGKIVVGLLLVASACACGGVVLLALATVQL